MSPPPDGVPGSRTLALQLDTLKREAQERERAETARKFETVEDAVDDVKQRLFPDVYDKIDKIKERLIVLETIAAERTDGATRGDKLQIAAGGTALVGMFELLQTYGGAL